MRNSDEPRDEELAALDLSASKQSTLGAGEHLQEDQERSGGIEWVRASDLLARESMRAGERGVKGLEAITRYARSRFNDRAGQLPPVSAFDNDRRTSSLDRSAPWL